MIGTVKEISKLIFYNSFLEIIILNIAFLILSISDNIMLFIIFGFIVKFFMLCFNLTIFNKNTENNEYLMNLCCLTAFVLITFLSYLFFLFFTFYIRSVLGMINSENYAELFLLKDMFFIFISFLGINFILNFIIITLRKISSLKGL